MVQNWSVYPTDIQFIRQGRELKTMSNRYGFITFDNQTQSTNWELNISGSLPAIPTVASAQPSLPVAAAVIPSPMLVPTNHTTSVVMSSAAPTPVIRRQVFGTTSSPPNPFLREIQENLSRHHPTALSSQFNNHPVTLVPNFPPPTTFSNFVASTPQNKHPTRKKVILPQSNQSSSSEASYHKNTNKKATNLRKAKVSEAQFMNLSTRHLRVLKDKPLPSPPLRRHCFPQSQPRLLLQLQSPGQQGHHY